MKKTCRLLLVMVMVFSIFLPINANAEEVTRMLYQLDGYTVEYHVVENWSNNQNINVTITNTGNETIEGWALKYNAGGEINGLWNAVIYDCTETEYIIKNAGYNYEIEPDNSVTFGYILTSEKFNIPQEIKICSQRVEKENGYNVELIKKDDWGTGFQGEINISNLTDKPIEAWTLIFDCNFVIEDLWNTKLISQNGTTYEIANQQWTTPILPDSTATLGFKARVAENVQPVIENAVLTEIIINDKTKPNLPYISGNYDEGIYYKEITDESEIVFNSDGLPYVRNQILVMADDSVSFQQMSDIAHNMNAEIVGYIDIINKYQIEFNSDVDIDYLQNIIDKLYDNPLIEQSSLNYFFNIQNALLSDDEVSKIENRILENNWNFYAINVLRAWKYYDCMSPVKVGIVDYVFDKNNNNLKFEKIWNYSENISKLPIDQQNHGTQIAGIMASKVDNDDGVIGICPKAKLYGCCLKNSGFQMKEEASICKPLSTT